MQMTISFTAVSILALIFSGCDGEKQASRQTCEPFEAVYEEASVGETAIVIQAEDGTLYVLDQHPSEEILRRERLYIASDGSLVRQGDVHGHLRLPLMPGHDGFVSWQESGLDKTIEVESDDTGKISARICIEDVTWSRETGEKNESCLQLTLLDDVAIEEMPVQNVPGERIVEVIALMAGGEHVVVMRPEVDWSDDQYRIFVGPPGKMVEYTVTEVVRSLCNSVVYNFNYNGMDAFAHIDWDCPNGSCGGSSDDLDEPTGCYLYYGNVGEPLTLVVRGHTEDDPHWGGTGNYNVADYRFLCL
jgi:hypothetical protein